MIVLGVLDCHPPLGPGDAGSSAAPPAGLLVEHHMRRSSLTCEVPEWCQGGVRYGSRIDECRIALKTSYESWGVIPPHVYLQESTAESSGAGALFSGDKTWRNSGH